MDEVMDIEGLSQYLKLAPITLYKMVKAGKVPCRRIGKSLRFPKSMIDRWLNEETVPDRIKPSVAQFAQRVRTCFGGRVKAVRLYGSWARGEARIDSDIDVAVIVDRRDPALIRQVSDIASEVSLESDQFISPLVIEEKVHKRGVSENYPLHLAIERDGIAL